MCKALRLDALQKEMFVLNMKFGEPENIEPLHLCIGQKCLRLVLNPESRADAEVLAIDFVAITVD